MRADIGALDGQFGKARVHVEFAERRGGGFQGLTIGDDPLGQRIENLVFQRHGAVARGSDAAFQFGQLVGGKPHLTGERLAVEEGRVERGLAHPVAVLGGDLDEIAEHIVVANFQRLDAGLGLILRLQPSDDLTAFVAQAPGLVEFGCEPLANEVSIAAQVRRALDEG